MKTTLPAALQKKIIDFLTELPNVSTDTEQKAFIQPAVLDAQLQRQIKFPGATLQFFTLLVPMLAEYGDLEDGRNALEAILEAAKDLVGPNRQTHCEDLIEQWRTILNKKDDDEIPDYAEFARIVSEAEEKERLRIVWTLQTLATDEALTILSQIALHNDFLNARTIAIRALGEIGNPVIIDVLKETAYAQRAEIRAASIRALVKISDPATASIFRDLTEDSDVSVQAAAITAIGAIRATQYRKIVINFLTSENPELANAAEAALKNLNSRLRI